MTLGKELIPDPIVLINGLRDTGYNFNTALSDIIDNSVDAEANNIEIRIVKNSKNSSITVMVVDDGCGMDQYSLENGMRYGSNNFKKDPKRLGKFGLGLKTASSAFCKRYSLISRADKNSKYNMATWDLDIVAEKNKWELQWTEENEIPKAQIKLLEKIATRGHGTLVLWEKVDRLENISQKALNSYLKKFENHITMIYHRFLDINYKNARNITISINGKKIKAWDPYCLSEKETTLNGEMKKSIKIVKENGDIGEVEDAIINLRAFTLPSKSSFSSESKLEEARLSNTNMGFYVYRENRMISNADWLGIKQKEPHDSLCRIEFSFDYHLDNALHIDVKKSQITLNPELADWLTTWTKPYIKMANTRYRLKKIKENSKYATLVHQSSDNIISKNEDKLKRSTLNPISEMDPLTRKQDFLLENRKIKNEDVKYTVRIPDDEIDNSKRLQYIFPVPTLDDGVLWFPTFKDKHEAVYINTSHPFYQKVYVPNHQEGIVMDGLDSLIWAMAAIEYDSAYSSETQELFEEIRVEVSRKLKILVKDLPEPEDKKIKKR